jgi:hypothetical protein
MQAAIQRLAMFGKKVVFALRHKCAELCIFDLALQCQLFDALVKPMLSYGCEVWSDHMAREQLEVVHRAFLKLSLGVSTTTSSYVVLVEFGRFPLKIFWWQETMRFLSHVSSEVDLDHMLRLAYDVQLQLLAARQKVLFGIQNIMGRKSQLPACWLAQVDERLLMYNLCIDSNQLPPCVRLKQLAKRQYIAHHQMAVADSSRVRAYLGLNSLA